MIHVVSYSGPLHWRSAAYADYRGVVKTTTSLSPIGKAHGYIAHCTCNWSVGEDKPVAYSTVQTKARAHLKQTFEDVC